MSDIETAQGQWAIVELMGHKVVSGLVTKDEQFGSPMLRVDVPATEAYPAYTQHYGVSAIYCITYVSEAVASRTAAHIQVNPVSVYVPDLVTREQVDAELEKYKKEIERLRLTRSLPSPEEPDHEPDDDEDDEDDGQPDL